MKTLNDIPGFEDFDFDKMLAEFFSAAMGMDSIDFFILHDQNKTKYIELREDLLKHTRRLWKLHKIPFLTEAYFSDKYTQENKEKWVKMALEDVNMFKYIISEMKLL
jgi:hypothetical protein